MIDFSDPMSSVQILIRQLKQDKRELIEELNLADELHFDECAEYQKTIRRLERELKRKGDH